MSKRGKKVPISKNIRIMCGMTGASWIIAMICGRAGWRTLYWIFFALGAVWALGVVVCLVLAWRKTREE